MPCNSDYLEPTEREKEHRRVAKLIVYVDSFFKGITPQWVINETKNHYARDSRLIPLLCEKLKTMSEATRKQIVYNAHNKDARDLADWYETHLEADKIREKEERKASERKRLRQQALLKLTDDERKALGL